jgi:DNA-binding LacI/PurR family transcriptional regulator
LRGVGEALADTDYSVLIRAIEHAEARDTVFRDCCARERADGALFISILPGEELADRVLRDRYPIVLVDAEHPRFTSMSVDYALGMARAVEHCIALGHRRIALIDRHQDPFATEYPTLRQRGYRAAMAEAGLPTPAEYERIADFSMAAGADATAALLQLESPPTAIVTGSDVLAMGALDLARKMRLRVPRDISIVGYNDTDMSDYLGLTTVQVPMRRMGYEATLALLEALERPSSTPRAVRLDTELIVRRTCGAPAGTAAAS